MYCRTKRAAHLPQSYFLYGDIKNVWKTKQPATVLAVLSSREETFAFSFQTSALNFLIKFTVSIRRFPYRAFF